MGLELAKIVLRRRIEAQLPYNSVLHIADPSGLELHKELLEDLGDFIQGNLLITFHVTSER